jgi:hypothetical protein
VTFTGPGGQIPDPMICSGNFVDPLVKEVPFSRSHNTAIAAPILHLACSAEVFESV